jgi:hypothetical protein
MTIRSRMVVNSLMRRSPDRDRLDSMAWEVIDKTGHHSTPPSGLAASGRPANYAELAELSARWDHELAWSEFLHEFFRYKQATFFAVAPPRSFSPQRRALLAGVGEYPCTRYSLPVPESVHDPQYTLPEPRDLWEDLCPDMEETRQGRIERSPEVLLKRNVVYEARNLITL